MEKGDARRLPLCVIKTLSEVWTAPAVIIIATQSSFIHWLAINKLVGQTKLLQGLVVSLTPPKVQLGDSTVDTRPNRSHHNVHVQLHAQMHIHMAVRQWYYAIAACPSISGDFFPWKCFIMHDGDIMGGGDPAMENQELERVIFPAL